MFSTRRSSNPGRVVLLAYLRRHHIALVALFVALGGTSYAAVSLPASSVGSKQIKTNAVSSSKVANGSLLRRDFKSGQLPAGAAGAKGASGNPGAPGAPGATGAPGAPGATGPAGPTASSFSSHDPADFGIGNVADTQVIALTDETNGRSGGLLVVPFNARVIVNGSLYFYTTSTASNVFCRAKIAPVGGSYTTISQQTHDTVVGSVQMPIAAAVDVGPGTYNVQAACYYNGVSGPQVFFDKGDITAIAVGR